MATIIGLKQFRENTEAITQRVAQGESFTVVKRSRPIFNITPVQADLAVRDREVADWTRGFINRYRPAFEALADK
jgi:antitoxin (DNA-binding transcriptional repressor) of toxin-antitoxin stability system